MHLLSELKRIFLHIRPALQLYTVLGFTFAGAVLDVDLQEMIIPLVSWLFLTSGLTVFNSYYDEDKNPVAGLKNPPEVSKPMLYGSLLMKLTGLLIALTVNYIFVIVYVLCAVITILYSHRTTRLKRNGYIALFVNFLVGLLTFYAVFSLTGEKYSTISLVGFFVSGVFLASTYAMMQVHQIREDLARGDRSFASIWGEKETVLLTIVLFLIASIGAIFLFYTQEKFITLFLIALAVLIELVYLYYWYQLLQKESLRVNHFKHMTVASNLFVVLGNLVFIISIVIY